VRNIEYLSYLRLVKELLQPFHGQPVLDVGCGDGRFCYELKDEHVELSGVDFSERAITFARAFNPSVSFFVHDLLSLRLPKTFDAAVMIETLEHFPPEKTSLVLKNISSVLKEGGTLVLTVPSTNLPLATKHYQHFTASSLRELLSQHFDVVRVLGHSRDTSAAVVFLFLKRVGLVLLPFRRFFPFLHHYYSFLRRYYEKYLRLGKPEECTMLVAVCRKR